MYRYLTRGNTPSRSASTVSSRTAWPSLPDIPSRRSPEVSMTRDEALALMHEYTASDALRKHMYAVEIAMRAMAERQGEDPDAWGLVGLLHDFDYERFPNAAHAAGEEHPPEGVRVLTAAGLPDASGRAILGH